MSGCQGLGSAGGLLMGTGLLGLSEDNYILFFGCVRCRHWGKPRNENVGQLCYCLRLDKNPRLSQKSLFI